MAAEGEPYLNGSSTTKTPDTSVNDHDHHPSPQNSSQSPSRAAAATIKKKGKTAKNDASSSSSWIKGGKGVIAFFFLVFLSLLVSSSYIKMLPSVDSFLETIASGATTTTTTLSSVPSLVDRTYMSNNRNATAYLKQVMALDSQSNNETQVAWLLSFPNSGTSYTLAMTQWSTQNSVATNYMNEILNQQPPPKTAPTPINSAPNAPYHLNMTLPLSHPVVLTKTHCTGYCETCLPPPSWNEFSTLCRSITTFTDPRPAAGGAVDSNRRKKVFRLPYSARLVRGAIHLFRSPFDNIVARMHLGKERRSKTTGFAKQLSEQNLDYHDFTDTPDGLLAWCQHVDGLIPDAELKRYLSIVFDNRIPRSVYEDLPCKTEWLRYVQWHNYALEMLDDFHIPVVTLYYEDYTSEYDKTVESILRFLGQKRQADPPPFISSKTYEGLFTSDLALKVKNFMEAGASPNCWKLIRHYFDAEWIVGKKNLALFLSFPNSGTSYTMTNTVQMTNMTVATNHGQEVDHVGRTPVRPDVSEGPFLLHPQMPVPHLVLTKSHCYGFCFDCTPSPTLDHFSEHCTTASTNAGGGGLKRYQYNTSIVKAIVHLVRDPLDNIVSRMHHGMEKGPALKLLGSTAEERIRQAQDSREGFLEWCRAIDPRFMNLPGGKAYLQRKGATVVNLFNTVPCAADLVRYTEWHNHAYAIAEQLNVPQFHLFYENYTYAYNDTVKALYKFLKQPIQSPPLHFKLGKTYRHWYQREEFQNAKQLVQAMASPATWETVQHYFAQYDNVPDSAETSPDIGAEEPVGRVELTTDAAASSLLSPTLMPTSQIPEEGPGFPHLMWLLSFPNSGTSYTMSNFQHMTNTSAASNYAREVVKGPLVKARPDLALGPFLVQPEFGTASAILVKTHCFHYCDVCFLKNHTTEEFSMGCRKNFADKKNPHYYRPQLIKRSIHLFRNIFDNLVARKHLGMRMRVNEQPVKYADSPMNADTREGFLQWCDMVDKFIVTVNKRQHYLEDKIIKLIMDVPCGGEVYRYVQWHNAAIDVTDQMGIPVLYVYYEDYERKFNDTIQTIADFWEVPIVQGPNPFITGKSYLELFSPEHQNKIARLVQTFASPKTWVHLQHYFPLFQEQGSTTSSVLYAGGSSLAIASSRTTPLIAWLLSFPNSGTTYTLANVEQLSNTTVGTNYADKVEKVVPIIPGQMEGPFYDHYELPVPPKYILTKTHCAAYCDSCGLEKSIITLDNFEYGCGRGTMDAKRTVSHYSPSLATRVVHLFRDPWNNIVSRMHHGRMRRQVYMGWNEAEASIFNNTREGVMAWCSYIDTNFMRGAGKQTRNQINIALLTEKFSASVRDLMRKVPCHSDIFRYVQWHSHAMTLVKNRNLPVHYVYYEDYESKFNDTSTALLEFLELKPVQGPLHFEIGKRYRDFFTDEERGSTKLLIRELAPDFLWPLLERYFEGK